MDCNPLLPLAFDKTRYSQDAPAAHFRGYHISVAEFRSPAMRGANSKPEIVDELCRISHDTTHRRKRRALPHTQHRGSRSSRKRPHGSLGSFGSVGSAPFVPSSPHLRDLPSDLSISAVSAVSASPAVGPAADGPSLPPLPPLYPACSAPASALSSAMDSDDFMLDLTSSPPHEYEEDTTLGTIDELQSSQVQQDHLQQLEQRQQLEKSAHSSAELQGLQTLYKILELCIEEGNPKVMMESLGLTSLPDQILDLAGLVCFPDSASGSSLTPQIEIYAAHNSLQSLSRNLFRVDTITVLSLRNNRLTRIPPAIRRLRSLVDFSVGGNELRYLPAELLELPKLEVLSVRPNPLLELQTKDKTEETGGSRVSNTTESFACPRHLVGFAEVQWETPPHKRTPTSGPSLMELAFRALSQLYVPEEDQQEWHSVVRGWDQMAEIQQRLAEEHRCATCQRPLCLPAARQVEWWTIGAATAVPVMREYCSGRCVEIGAVRSSKH